MMHRFPDACPTQVLRWQRAHVARGGILDWKAARTHNQRMDGIHRCRVMCEVLRAFVEW